ncbi:MULTISPECIES: ClpX C4-type zinc finger protein [unclassified Phaeobacter]|uniref:ClpX C4-type zinc finger protein n=1 Tax=unclassified Phaeobacter TaxID=2621772 RepID=UPI003A86F59B
MARALEAASRADDRKSDGATPPETHGPACVLACSFCSTQDGTGALLIKGAGDACICSNCVSISVRLLSDRVAAAMREEREAGND